ncbi:MAG TPA: hypothetical protein VMF06_14705 [Candidatus Limnocylindria bacterium]|jgi:hypothetical protein|nr:hypothetical protein [Candidatus Limnocylindria bacterium]
MSRGNSEVWRYVRTTVGVGERQEMFCLDGRIDYDAVDSVLYVDFLFVGGCCHGHRIRLSVTAKTHSVANDGNCRYERWMVEVDGRKGSAFFLASLVEVEAFREALKNSATIQPLPGA